MEKSKLLPRDSFFDNYRAILIFMVVICHLISPLARFFSIKFIYRYCYIFHMPAMLFVSGYFFKSSVKDGKLVKDKIFNFTLLYVVFQIIFTFINEGKFSLYQSQSGLWYIQVLIIYSLIVPILDRLNPKFCIPLTFALGLVIGEDNTAGHVASLSRAVVFLPFFMVGYYLSSDWVENFKEKKNILIGIIATAATGALYYFAFDITPWMLNMSSGKASYASMRMSFLEGVAYRSIWYVAAFLLILVFALVSPKRNTIFSGVGKRTLSVFLLHLPLCVLLRKIEFYQYFKNMNEVLVVCAFIAITAAVCFIAGSKWIYWPFEKLMGINFKGIIKEKN